MDVAVGQRIRELRRGRKLSLETVADLDGVVHPGEGWTRLVITPRRGLHANEPPSTVETFWISSVILSW